MKIITHTIVCHGCEADMQFDPLCRKCHDHDQRMPRHAIRQQIAHRMFSAVSACFDGGQPAWATGAGKRNRRAA